MSDVTSSVGGTAGRVSHKRRELLAIESFMMHFQLKEGKICEINKMENQQSKE